MQTLGELLIKSREEKGYTVDQVIHETNISRSYIENLEAENFEQFPAEAYLIGFLRTYADYLGLDQDRVITLYRNHKLREEPAPLEALVGKKRPSIPLPVLLILAAVLALGRRVTFCIRPSRSGWKSGRRNGSPGPKGKRCGVPWIFP